MNNLISVATIELVNFLQKELPLLSDQWWDENVMARLSFQQQRVAMERRYTNLSQLDFAALLRVLDQNWYELSSNRNMPREARSWVKELQTVRNKWAHLSNEAMPQSEIYRDADTLGRVLSLIGAAPESTEVVEAVKSTALLGMSNPHGSRKEDPSIIENVPASSEASVEAGVNVEPSATPISLYRAGDLIALRSDPTTILPIIDVIPGGGEYRYLVFQNNTKTSYYESQLQAPHDTDEKPTPLTTEELHARLTAFQILSPSTANLFSLHSGRVHFVPYQYRPVLKLIRSDRPRLLIADEVGVGKTIEAGLIIKELRARMDLSSVLIICPKALVAERKWFLEMKRFDEHFTALDGKLLKHCVKETHLDGEWPEQYAKAILPFSLFDSDLVFGRQGPGRRNDQGLLNLDPPPKFDLVIVDEAHHIRNSETFLHQGIRFLCDNAGAVIFLTATPVQLGSNDLFTLLNVLRPDLVIDPASFALMAEPNRHINTAVQFCRASGVGWQEETRDCLDQAAQTEWGRLFVRESTEFQSIYDRLQDDSVSEIDRVAMIRSIEELYTFSGLINRTRRRDIGEFTTRKPETLTVDFTPAQKDLHDHLLSVIARILEFCHGQQNVKFMMTTIRRQAASCLYGLAPLLGDILSGKLDHLEFVEASDDEEDPDLTFVDEIRNDVEVLLEKAHDLDPYDPKVEAFVQVLNGKSRLPNNKALVFSTFRHTLAYLAKHTERTGLRYGLIHGSIPDTERAELRRRFALPKEDVDAIDVQLSSEVGCEGLDFQFCDFLVNYDLPWNPMRIEQRIGRIDRYGQKSETVAIVNFVTPGTVDADIYERCLWRIGVFQHAIGGNEEILGEVTQELHDIAESFDLSDEEREARLKQLADNGIRLIQEQQELESRQAEFFGLNVPNQAWKQEIEATGSYWLSRDAIQRCVSAYLSGKLGSDSEQLLGDKELKTLRLGQEARSTLLEDFKRLPRSSELVSRDWDKWLRGGQPTLSVTFDQQTAAENPKTVHLWVAHPLVRQSANYFKFYEPKQVHLSIQSLEVPEGDYFFALYRWIKRGVREDETLVPISTDPAVERELLRLIEDAIAINEGLSFTRGDLDNLEASHHSRWTNAQADHIDENRRQVEYRIQSLTVSHRARCKAIKDQIARASNEKIVLMKTSELNRVNADFDRRISELQNQASSGDIHTSLVLFGIIRVAAEKQG